MSQRVHLEVFYPYPRERVWQVLTDRRALAAWMMENNFEPKLGHKFQFYSCPLPGLETMIQCEVVELEQPTRLVYTWQESPGTEPSLVIWTLTAVTGGTQLRLKHGQYSYMPADLPAMATANRSSTASLKRTSVGEAASFYNSGLSRAKQFHAQQSHAEQWSSPSELSLPSHRSNWQKPHPAGQSATLALPTFQSFTWDYFLHQTLPKALEEN